MKRILISVSIALASLAAPAISSELELAQLAELPVTETRLTITGENGAETVFNLADIEMLDTYTMETTTPWRENAVRFAGVLLSDLLASAGINSSVTISVWAENDYRVEIPPEVWAETPMMVVTRVDDRRLSRRERGPILFMVDAETYAASDTITESHLVWMVARIAPAS